jgi:hypothetical protein
MTDRNAAPGTAPPVITGNIRAEMARAGMTVAATQRHLEMSAPTWERRMRNPGTWKWSELEKLAALLHVAPARLVVGE